MDDTDNCRSAQGYARRLWPLSLANDYERRKRPVVALLYRYSYHNDSNGDSIYDLKESD